MTGEQEIRLFGQPIRIRVPGSKKNRYVYSNNPAIKGETLYEGYALCDLKDVLMYGWREIYIEVNDSLYNMADYLGYEKTYSYQILDYVTIAQQEVTFERIHRMCIFLYNQINELRDEVSGKVDRRDSY